MKNGFDQKIPGDREMMDAFIVGHYINKMVDVYCGEPDKFEGVVEGCSDGVLTLKKDDAYTHIATNKIVAIWEKL